jgi:hypothetical protein
MDVDVSFVVRRARLLMGMTQAEFAELFEVDDGTVSRCERGKLQPAPKVWKRNREITLKEDSLRDEAVHGLSPNAVSRCAGPVAAPVQSRMRACMRRSPSGQMYVLCVFVPLDVRWAIPSLSRH